MSDSNKPPTRDSFRTPQFRAVWAEIEHEVERLKEEAVGWVHEHEAYVQKIGAISGLRRAGELLREVEKTLIGEHK